MNSRIPIAHSYLTAREAQVVSLYSQGIRPKIIAERLGISRKTIDSLTRHARERFNDCGIVELIRIYEQERPAGIQ